MLIKERFQSNEIPCAIVMGDFNARIGKSQQPMHHIFSSAFLTGFEKRKSKDKTMNLYVTDLIEFSNDYGMIVLNGRIVREYSFVNTNESYMNDLCLASIESLSCINSFSVEEKIWSDHLPKKFTFKMETADRETKKRKLPSKLKWDKKKQTVCRQRC